MEKYIKINIENSFILSHKLNINNFLASQIIRDYIIKKTLKTISYKDFAILNIISLKDKFIIEAKLSTYDTHIFKFENIINVFYFSSFLKNNNFSIYFFENEYFFILYSKELSPIFSDFDELKYTPEFHFKIVKNGKKLIQ